MLKKLAIGLVCLIVLLGAGIYFLMTNLDGLIRNAVENYGSAATQSDVRLDTVNLTLQTGEGKLGGLKVANPKGFATPQAFYLGSINVKVDTSTIRGDGPIVISSIVIDKPQVTYELLNTGDSNLQAVQKNTEAYANRFKSPEGAQPTKEQAKQQGQGRKIIIKNLIIRNGQVTIAQEMLKGKQLSTALPEIHLTNIGQASNGATAAEVTKQIVSSISTSAMQSGVAELAKQKISGLLKQVPAGAIGNGAVDAVGSKLKGVFGN